MATFHKIIAEWEREDLRTMVRRSGPGTYQGLASYIGLVAEIDSTLKSEAELVWRAFQETLADGSTVEGDSKFYIRRDGYVCHWYCKCIGDTQSTDVKRGNESAAGKSVQQTMWQQIEASLKKDPNNRVIRRVDKSARSTGR